MDLGTVVAVAVDAAAAAAAAETGNSSSMTAGKHSVVGLGKIVGNQRRRRWRGGMLGR